MWLSSSSIPIIPFSRPFYPCFGQCELPHSLSAKQDSVVNGNTMKCQGKLSILIYLTSFHTSNSAFQVPLPRGTVPDPGSFISRTSVYWSAVTRFTVAMYYNMNSGGSGGNSVWDQGKQLLQTLQCKHNVDRCFTAQPPAPSTARATGSLPGKKF